jgi:NAD+ diphosphatase
MSPHFTPLVTLPTDTNQQAIWFIFNDKKVLVTSQESGPGFPVAVGLKELGLQADAVLYLGRLDDMDCYACIVPDHTAPPGMEFVGLRGVFGRSESVPFNLALRALHLVEWDRLYRYCPGCGTPMTAKQDLRAKECGACGFIDYPRMSPAVIVLVEREDKVLLARATRFAENIYSVLAGFVEPGETLEDTVKREIKEETGIDVKEITYFGSQPWPFPDSLMIGFTAQYAGGEIVIDGEELVDARWFSVDDLPMLPGKVSIARKLIDWFVNKQQAGKGPRA